MINATLIRKKKAPKFSPYPRATGGMQVSFLGTMPICPDLIKLGGMPITERRENHHLTLFLKPYMITTGGLILSLIFIIPVRTLRPLKRTTLKVPLESSIFQDSASNVFNLLPSAAEF